MTANYHERFENLHSSAVQTVRETSSPIWNADDSETELELMQQLCGDLAAVYDIPEPGVAWGDKELYRPTTSVIELPHASLVSLLHEFRHHMQHNDLASPSDIEDDARAWSISMFAEARPRAFDKAWRNERIWFMPPHPEENR